MDSSLKGTAACELPLPGTLSRAKKAMRPSLESITKSSILASAFPSAGIRAKPWVFRYEVEKWEVNNYI